MTITVGSATAAVAWSATTPRSLAALAVGAGDSIIVVNAAANRGGATDPAFSFSDGASYTLSSFKDTTTAHRTVQVGHRHGLSAASYTITGTMAGGGGVTNYVGQFIAFGVSGLANAGPGTAGTGSATPFDGSTVAVSVAADTIVSGSYLHIAVAFIGVDPASSNFTAPAGFTSLLTDQTSVNTDGSIFIGYKISSSAEAVSYGTAGAMYYWAAATFPFAEAVVGQPTGKRMGGIPFIRGDSGLFLPRRW